VTSVVSTNSGSLSRKELQDFECPFKNTDFWIRRRG